MEKQTAWQKQYRRLSPEWKEIITDQIFTYCKDTLMDGWASGASESLGVTGDHPKATAASLLHKVVTNLKKCKGWCYGVQELGD
tara:strand:+ start:932 stop:1183 length:252 start_codon:yes stop_codon:yes gene_type:complete